MAWWWWVLIWVVLLVVSAGALFLLARSLWRKAVALGRELATATERLSAVSEGLNQLADRSGTESSVFTDPAQLRQERFLAGRRRDGRHSAKPANLGVRATRRADQRVR